MRTHKILPLFCLLLAWCLASTRTARADYAATALADNPVAFYRFNDSTVRNLINNNSGSLGPSANASNDLAFVTGGTVHPVPGAIVGDSDLAEFFDYTTRTEIPYNAGLNTPDNQPFTMEAWIYPVSDQAATGMGVLCNRYTQGPTRQGWVMYQRAADYNHDTNAGPGVGWELRMYNNVDTSGHLDVTSGVPFTLGKWQYVVAVYDPVEVTNATITMYIDGVAAATNIWNAPDGVSPGYYPCQDTNDLQPNGAPALSIGGYNNANGGTDGFENPWTGAVQHVAWYPAKLTPAQILAHYQSGTNANRSQSYSSLILAANPSAYLRLDERAPSPDVAVNFGDDRSSADATNTADVRHPAASAVTGDTKGGSASYHLRNGSATSDIPFLADNNPGAGIPFTFEAWFRPLNDRISPGAASVNNRYVSSGNRTGWVIFQRAPDTNYDGYTPDYEGTGWTFRMYSGDGSGGQDTTTGVGWTQNVWQHFVVTWQPQVDNGDVGGNGNDQWQGILTAYIDGVAVQTNASALYAANVSPTEDATTPADLAIGSYNAVSGLGDNPYEGDVDHLAIYNGTLLSPAQIMTHYQAGVNGNNGTSYETLVFQAGSESYLATNSAPIPEMTTIPKTYLTFGDPAHWPAANSGTLGYLADGNLIDATNSAAGPRPPTYAGFDAFNLALPLNGSNEWASFNDPDGLAITGQISLEAWVQVGANQGPVARIISHGPQTLSDYLGALGGGAYGPFENGLTNSTEVFLRLDDSGADYAVGTAQFGDTADGTNEIAATFAVPSADTAGAWVHLVGTYDGSKWNLYRNGALVGTKVSATGALAVPGADWAIGAAGEGWADNFNGAVDEAAIYNYALSPSKVAAHYLAGKDGTSAISVAPGSSGTILISWPADATLQESTTVTGPYTDVPGSPATPLSVPATGTMFYRWRL